VTHRTWHWQASHIYVGVKNIYLAGGNSITYYPQTFGIENSLLGCLTEKFVVFIVVGNRDDFLTWKPRTGSSHSVLILQLITAAELDVMFW
jgi:hypothetical protein